MHQSLNAFNGNPKMRFLFFLVSSLLSLAVCYQTQAQARGVDAFPVPKFNSNTQFYLQRTTDANTIMYDLNLKNGLLNDQDPIKPYWIRYTEKVTKKGLTGIQNKYAFGVTSTKVTARHYKLQFAAYSKIPLHLKQQSNGSYQTSVHIDGRELILQRLYIHIEPGGTFWSPNVAYIEFMGKDIASGRSVQKRIKP